MVDNILTASGDSVPKNAIAVDHRSESMTSTSSSDTESDAMSDIKDSLCGSPRRVADTLMPSMPFAGREKYQLSESLLRTYAMIRQGSAGVGLGGMEESCCSKCGHFQTDRRSAKSLGVKDEDDIAMQFRCERCGGRDAMASVLTGRSGEANTILKDGERATIVGASGVTKPILKFSVSAILGDRKECVKVRNGK